MTLAVAMPIITASFLASIVEAVEALTIVLAVGTTRGWRPALTGTGLGVASLAAATVILGPFLDRVPLGSIQLGMGTLLLLFGVRWLRKAILRAAGIIALHDEDKAFARTSATLQAEARLPPSNIDRIGLLTSFNAVVVEGIEVVFIVIAMGAGRGLILPSAIGAAAACAVVAGAGLIVHRPLAKVPENTLKFIVGVMLTSFGMFWVGEGLGVAWPGDELSVAGLIAVLAIVALLCVAIARRKLQETLL